MTTTSLTLTMTNPPRTPTGTPRRAALDRAEFSALYRDAYGVLRVVASAQAGSAHADDVVQEAAVVAMARLDRFTPDTDFRAWMAAIVRGVARNHRRGERRRDARTRRLAGWAGGAASAGSGVADPAQEADEGALRNALEALGHLQRECLLLKVVLDYSYREIGAILDLPEGTARSHVHRARARLLEIMGPEDGGRADG